MEPSSKIIYNPADHGAPISLLPEEVFGHVDLETLANIHRYLCESELQEDTELATWIWENYLNGLWTGSPTAEIRTAQAFGKLDRAYRRVRSLTNKAQDKWPFFDRNFKKMSSATVRNNARGEAAPGIMYPIDGLQRKSHMARQSSNESITPNDSSVPESQVPFGTIIHTQNHPRPTQQTPVPLPSILPAKSPELLNSEMQTVALELPPSSAVSLQKLSKYTTRYGLSISYYADKEAQDVFSESDGRAQPQSEPSRSNAPQTEGAFDQDMSQNELGASLATIADGTMSCDSSLKLIEDPEVEPQVRDAGAGKVRGPNGRYLPRNDVATESEKTKKQKKVANTRTRMRSMDKRELSVPKAVSGVFKAAPVQDEEMFANAQSPSFPAFGQEAEDQNGVQEEASVLSVTGTVVSPATDAVAPPTAVDEQGSKEEEVASDPEPVPAYLLAAEAEAVPSNLDRLPPNSRKSNKRKSELIAQSGDRKRGKHGGIVGRPRKSEQRKGQETQQESNVSQKENAIDVEKQPQMTTRRATRRSAAANLSNSTSNKSTAKPQTNVPLERSTQTSKKSPKVPLNPGKPFTGSEDEMMGGAEEAAPNVNAIEVCTTPSSSLEEHPIQPQVSYDHLLSIGLEGTASPALPQPLSRSQPYQSSYQHIPSPPPSEFVAKQMTDSVAESVYLPGRVEYFARITTGHGGAMDLPIDENRLESNEVKMIKGYAKYNAEHSVVPVSYTQFRQIFAFAKQG